MLVGNQGFAGRVNRLLLSASSLQREECIDECICIEWLKISNGLTNTNKLDRNFDIINYTNHCSPFGCPVKFGQDQTCHANSFMELPCLVEHIQACAITCRLNVLPTGFNGYEVVFQIL